MTTKKTNLLLKRQDLGRSYHEYAGLSRQAGKCNLAELIIGHNFDIAVSLLQFFFNRSRPRFAGMPCNGQGATLKAPSRLVRERKQALMRNADYSFFNRFFELN
jgi:hypothetical protein